MDNNQFDHLSRSVATAGPRRGVLRLLGALPLLGALLTLVDDEEAGAKRRRKSQRRGGAERKGVQANHHDRGHGRNEKNKKNKKHKKHDKHKNKKKCKPESAAQTCAGKCGDVLNNCGDFVTCDPCTCDPACEFCERCNEELDNCEPDPAKVGTGCGECQACGGDGTCEACANTCCQTLCCGDAQAICHVDTGACCVPETEAETCASKCGEVSNNCGKKVTCAPCTCGSGCDFCERCNESSNNCEPDPDKVEDECGEPGQVCQADGSCACDSGSCAAGQFCDGSVCACAGCLNANGECGPCLAFITSTPYTGKLGGLEGADAKCQARADAANLPGTYKAWLSDSTGSPATRFNCTATTCSSKGYTRVDGVTIASDWEDLSSCVPTNATCITSAISVTELNQAVTFGDVWTDTKKDGTPGGLQGNHCQNWSSANESGGNDFGDTGIPQQTNIFWTNFGGANCSQSYPIYCFQQG